MQPSYKSIEDGTKVKPRESMGLCVAILKLEEILRTRDMPHRNSILHNVRQALVLLLYSTFIFSVFVYLFVAREIFSDMIENIAYENIAYAITLTVLTSKMNVIMFRSDKVQHIVTTVQENFFIHGTELSIENRKIIKYGIKLLRKITIAYLTLQTSVWVVYLAGPQISFDVMLQTHNTTNISSETVVYERKLPLRIWIPLDVTRSPQFNKFHNHTELDGN
jgi:hypothetical protein